MSTEKTVYWVFGIIVVTIVGFWAIPPLIKKYGNRLYKTSLKKDTIDYENMGPEIVKKDKSEEE